MSKVCIIGPPKVGKKTLLNGLFALGGQPVGESPQLRIENKYFAADLDFIVADAAEAAALEGAEAVIVVVSCTDASSPSLVRSLSDAIDAQDRSLVLVVANMVDAALGIGADSPVFGELQSGLDSVDARPEYRALADQLESGALDHGYEHLPCCALAPQFTAQSRDKSGLARVYEALQNVSWKAARMHAAAGPVSRPVSASVDLHASESAADPASQRKGAGSASGGGISAGSCSNGTSAAPEMMLARGIADAPLRLDTEHDRGDVGLDDAGEPEHAADIARLVEEMKHVRGAALAGAVSDDQRREAAARMALRLFEMLGGAGSEDDDEDGE